MNGSPKLRLLLLSLALFGGGGCGGAGHPVAGAATTSSPRRADAAAVTTALIAESDVPGASTLPERQGDVSGCLPAGNSFGAIHDPGTIYGPSLRTKVGNITVTITSSARQGDPAQAIDIAHAAATDAAAQCFLLRAQDSLRRAADGGRQLQTRARPLQVGDDGGEITVEGPITNAGGTFHSEEAFAIVAVRGTVIVVGSYATDGPLPDSVRAEALAAKVAARLP